MKESLHAFRVLFWAMGFLFLAFPNVHAQSKPSAVTVDASRPTIGQVIPEVHLRDSVGELRSLSSLRGKVVLLDFWASWCGPCRRANPALKKLYSRYHSKGFEIYAVSLDRSGTSWKQAIRSDDLQWIQVIDETSAVTSLASKWSIDYIPTSFLLGKNGRVMKINPGHRALKTFLKKRL